MSVVHRYAATVRVQKHRQEIIEDLSAMVKEHLVMFYKSTGRYRTYPTQLLSKGLTKEDVD